MLVRTSLRAAPTWYVIAAAALVAASPHHGDRPVARPAVPAPALRVDAQADGPHELAEVEDRMPLSFRVILDGLAVTPRRETYVLCRDGHTASLHVTSERRQRDREPSRWAVEHTETFVGRMEDLHARFVFHLTAATGRALDFNCRRTLVAAHAPDAELVRPPRHRQEVPDVAIWRPAQTEPVEVMACEGVVPAEGFTGATLMLAAWPGLDRVELTNDILNGAGYRRRANVMRMGIDPPLE